MAKGKKPGGDKVISIRVRVYEDKDPALFAHLRQIDPRIPAAVAVRMLCDLGLAATKSRAGSEGGLGTPVSKVAAHLAPDLGAFGQRPSVVEANSVLSATHRPVSDVTTGLKSEAIPLGRPEGAPVLPPFAKPIQQPVPVVQMSEAAPVLTEDQRRQIRVLEELGGV